MQFKTKSGSLYEVIKEEKKIRRIYGELEPTQRQGDNEFKNYEEITPIEIGKRVLILWNNTIVPAAVSGAVPTTLTSTVVEIISK